MAAWRRRALESFPDLRTQLNTQDFTTYDLFRELVARAHDAHDQRDESRLDAIYGFAEWCFDQKAKDLWNAAGVSFYEDLFHGPGWHLRKLIMRRIPARIAAAVWELWERYYSAEQVEALRQLLPPSDP
ncbi:MAG: hypothetical protein QNJ90_10545 [Planctomycetota bacterium]|nr:hypothetical protein [Planctomycetota bacterium]